MKGIQTDQVRKFLERNKEITDYNAGPLCKLEVYFIIDRTDMTFDIMRDYIHICERTSVNSYRVSDDTIDIIMSRIINDLDNDRTDDYKCEIYCVSINSPNCEKVYDEIRYPDDLPIKDALEEYYGFINRHRELIANAQDDIKRYESKIDFFEEVIEKLKSKTNETDNVE